MVRIQFTRLLVALSSLLTLGASGSLIDIGNALGRWSQSLQEQAKRQSETDQPLNVFCYLYHTALYSSLSEEGPRGFDWKSDEIWCTCTHIVYAFASIDGQRRDLSSTEARLDLGPNDTQQRGGRHDMMRKLNQFKRRHNEANPAKRPVKMLLSVGGASTGEASLLNEFASDPSARRQFAKNAAQYLINYGFDGLDLDWEYPDSEQLLTDLVRELRQQLHRRSALLTLTLPPGVWTARRAYNLASVSKFVDHLNIMAYDYYGPWSAKSGSNAPLRARAPEEAHLNVDQIVQYYKGKLSNAGDQSWKKLGLGIPFYARGFLLAPGSVLDQLRSRKLDTSSASSGHNLAFDYEFVCNKIAQRKLLTFARDPHEVTPGAIVEHAPTNKRMYLSWEDPVSILAKIEYAKQEGLGSVMIWKLDTDDYVGQGPGCSPPDDGAARQAARHADGPSRGRFPLLSAVRRAVAS